ncbi:MAG: hypothetical protein PHR51_02625 [Patescibacteria group bacterium]|nr:hypothetical protein [Patescibacteria group bacterium]
MRYLLLVFMVLALTVATPVSAATDRASPVCANATVYGADMRASVPAPAIMWSADWAVSLDSFASEARPGTTANESAMTVTAYTNMMATEPTPHRCHFYDTSTASAPYAIYVSDVDIGLFDMSTPSASDLYLNNSATMSMKGSDAPATT